jgi:hypothetical protein
MDGIVAQGDEVLGIDLGLGEVLQDGTVAQGHEDLGIDKLGFMVGRSCRWNCSALSRARGLGFSRGCVAGMVLQRKGLGYVQLSTRQSGTQPMSIVAYDARLMK